MLVVFFSCLCDGLLGVTYANMLVTTQWPLKRAAHLTSLVWVCVVWLPEILMEISALWSKVNPCWQNILFYPEVCALAVPLLACIWTRSSHLITFKWPNCWLPIPALRYAVFIQTYRTLICLDLPGVTVKKSPPPIHALLAKHLVTGPQNNLEQYYTYLHCEMFIYIYWKVWHIQNETSRGPGKTMQNEKMPGPDKTVSPGFEK